MFNWLIYDDKIKSGFRILYLSNVYNTSRVRLYIDEEFREVLQETENQLVIKFGLRKK